MPDPSTTTTVTTAALPPGPGDGREETERLRLEVADLHRHCGFQDDEIARLRDALNGQADTLLAVHRKLSDREVELADLRSQLGSMTAERNAYASAALAGLSAFGCTPMEGYVKDGGVSLMTADFKRAREAFKQLNHYAAQLEGELKTAEAKNAALIKQNEFLHGTLADQEKELASLRADVAEQHAIIANQEKSLFEGVSTIASLRASLATASERERRLVEAAKELETRLVAASVFSHGGPDYKALCEWRSALAAYPAPEPAPAEGQS